MDWEPLFSARIPLSDGSVRSIAGCASPEHYPEQIVIPRASITAPANRIANSRYTFAGENRASASAVARTSYTADRKALTSAAGKL